MTSIEIRSELPEAPIAWKSGMTTRAGTPQVAAVWSVEGERTYAVVVLQEFVREDGSLFAEWRIPEVAGPLEQAKEPVEDPIVAGMENLKQYDVFPTFETFLASSGSGGGDVDPFGGGSDEDRNPHSRIYQGDLTPFPGIVRRDLIDLHDPLRAQGLNIDREKEQFVVLVRGTNRMVANLSPLAQELLEGILNAGCHDPPAIIALEFPLIRSPEKLASANLAAGEFEGIRKIGTVALPGSSAEVSIGGVFGVSFEAVIDANDTGIETRFEISDLREKEPRFLLKTGLDFQDGEPVIVQQSQDANGCFSWVGVASVIRLEDAGKAGE